MSLHTSVVCLEVLGDQDEDRPVHSLSPLTPPYERSWYYYLYASYIQNLGTLELHLVYLPIIKKSNEIIELIELWNLGKK